MKDNNPAEKNTKPKLKTVEQVSAGGVAFRQSGSQWEVVIVSVNPSRRWQIPKGIIDAGESAEIAARREVREEAGIEAEIISLVETIEYWYVGSVRAGGERVRFHKLVHFYLMRATGGDTASHDHEVFESRWMKIEEAIEMLAFKSEKAVIAKAFEMIIEMEREIFSKKNF